MVKGKITLPECWKKLIDVEFPEDLAGIKNGSRKHELVGLSDPTPYYDDQRAVTAKLRDGSTLTAFLCSGQGNYYGCFDIWKGEKCVYESEPLETWDFDAPGYEIEVKFK